MSVQTYIFSKTRDWSRQSRSQGGGGGGQVGVTEVSACGIKKVVS